MGSEGSRSASDTAGRIQVSVLLDLWRSEFGLDVARFFSSEQIELLPVPPYNFLRFSSSKPGDGQFYSDLMRRLGYDGAQKPEFMQAASQISQTTRVLDVGSGIGNFSVACPGVYRGIDTNETAIADGQRLGRNVHFGLIEDEPPESYDVVTVFQVLEHVESPLEFLRACSRSLRPGGLLMISTPNQDGVMGYATNEVLNYPPHHMSWWSESSLNAVAKDCGCEPISTWYEPLRKVHLGAALSALFWPRDERHLTRSALFPYVRLIANALGRIVRRKWTEVPFIKGHTVMVIARKRSTD
jgi:SAM-dependent methyltransferase